ncbi:hypothetical protein F4808DRAFT_361922 [Astrocystis sublimbata]|nr:hypothetical protein F4808DRAFT_361922 [Astrocystis sublimbata]
MRASFLTFLSAAAVATAQSRDAVIVVEKSLGNRYVNTTVQFPPTMDYVNDEVLGQVSSLYQIGPEFTYFCFAIKPDGTFYNEEYFGLDKPLHLSTNNVVVAAISCRIE